MSTIIGNAVVAAATLVSSNSFESVVCGRPGFAKGWGASADHNVFVTNVKAHTGEKSVCWITGKASQMACVVPILNAQNKEKFTGAKEVVFGYWILRDTANAGLDVEIRSNKGTLRDVTKVLTPEKASVGTWQHVEYRAPFTSDYIHLEAHVISLYYASQVRFFLDDVTVTVQ